MKWMLLLLLAGGLLPPNPLGAGTTVDRTMSCGLHPAKVAPTRMGGTLVYGDSIALGGWPEMLGWQADAQRCRALRADPGAAARMLAHKPDAVWLAIGTNDYELAPWTAELFGRGYGELLDQLQGRKVYAQTPLARSDEKHNRLGSTLPEYSAAIIAECSAREWCEVVDGRSLVPLSMMPDGVHPNDDGQRAYAEAVIRLSYSGKPQSAE